MLVEAGRGRGSRLVELVLGEEDAELDLAGAGAAVLAFAVPPAVSFAVMGTPVPSMTAYSLSGSGDGGSGTSLRAAIERGAVAAGGATAAPLASAARSTRLAVSRTRPVLSSRGGSARTARPRRPGRSSRPGRATWTRPATPSSASRGARPCPQAAQWYQARAQGDRPEHGVDDLVPVGDELRLDGPARTGPGGRGSRDRRPAAAPSMPQPAASIPAGSPPRPPPGRHRRSPATVAASLPGGLSRRFSAASALKSPLFRPPAPEGASVPAARPGLADLLVHLDDLLDGRRELRVPGHLAAHLLHLAAASCRPTVFRRPPTGSTGTSARARDDPGCAHAQFGFPHLR